MSAPDPNRPVSGSGSPVAVAVPEAVAGILSGPVRDGQVLTRLSRAAILILPPGSAEPGPPAVLALLAPGAAGTPHGLRLLRADTDAILAAADPGCAVTVGAGGLTLAGFRLRAARTVPSRIPALVVDPAALARLRDAGLAHPTGLPADADPAALVGAVLHAADADPTGPLLDLLGRGPGLTPSGDDLVAGLLAGLWASGRAGSGRIGAAVLRLAPGRTTLLSADLLGWAAHGHAGSEVLAVLAAAGRHPVDRARIDRAVQTLLAVGHTSGADLLAGLVAGLSGSQEFRTRQGGPIRLATRHGKDPP